MVCGGRRPDLLNHKHGLMDVQHNMCTYDITCGVFCSLQFYSCYIDELRKHSATGKVADVYLLLNASSFSNDFHTTI